MTTKISMAMLTMRAGGKRMKHGLTVHFEIRFNLMGKGNKGFHYRVLEGQISRRCCDAFLVLSICEDSFNEVDENLKPFPESEKFVQSAGKQCLNFLDRCAGGRGERNYLKGPLEFLKSRTIKNIIKARETHNRKESMHKILSLSYDLLENPNVAFYLMVRPNGHSLQDLKHALKALAKGV
jgi:hypothetical protein